jgi:ATPase family associated with various cellular activities (AAA)
VVDGGGVTDFDPRVFATEFRQFLKYVDRAAPEADDADAGPLVAARIHAFMDCPAESMAIAKESLHPRELPNVHLAIEAALADATDVELIGYVTEYEMGDFGLTSLLNPNKGDAPRLGPPAFVSFEMPSGRVQCIQKGLLFVRRGEERCVLLVNVNEERYDPRLKIQVLAPTADAAEKVLERVRREMRTRNIYKGQAIAVDGDHKLRFYSIPPVAREDLILPDEIIETIERNTIAFSAQAPRLLAAGRHLRRGLLLHGPPGTGKSMSVRYLVTRLQGRTTIVLTGRELGLIRAACELARLLAPSTVILEDVDLVAEERSSGNQSCSPLLFELMNEMDGLEGDADIIFLLTTNRPEILEPALTARPGRIDQAVEFPLPDDDCRRRLIVLYGEGLGLGDHDAEALVSRTAGTSPAFIRELLRKAAVYAGDRTPAGGALQVERADLENALRELLVVGGALTARLLGANKAAPARGRG